MNKHFFTTYFRYFSKSSQFYFFFLFMFLLTVYGGIFYGTIVYESVINIYDVIIYILSSSNYLVLLFLLFLLSTFIVYKNIDKNYLFSTRMETKSTYFQCLAKTVLVQNTFLFILNILFLFISLFLFKNGNLSISFSPNYHTYNIIYLLFFLLRYYLWLQLFSIFSIFLFSKVSSKLAFILNFILILYFFKGGYYAPDFVVYSLMDIGFHFEFLLFQYPYSNFFFEIILSILYLLCFASLFKFINFLYLRYTYLKTNHVKKGILTLIKCDIIYAIKHLYKIFLGYTFLLICMFIWLAIGYEDFMTIHDFYFLFGLAYFSNSGILALLLFVICLLFYLYISCYLSLKDIISQYHNLCLRTSAKKFLIEKLLSVMIITFIILLIHYGLITLLMQFTSEVSLYQLFSIFFKHILFLYGFQLTGMLILFLYYSYPKFKILIFILILFMAYLFIRPIIQISIIVLLIFDILVYILLINLFSVKHRIIFESLRKVE